MDIVLIGGLWLTASAWDAVASELTRLGHDPIPVDLPGQGDGKQATLDDQVDAVIAAVDDAPRPCLVVGHSAACTLAWLAADALPEKVVKVVLIGGFPSAGGTPYADFFPIVDGAMPFPGWEPFAGPDSADLTPGQKDAFAAAAVPVPEGVAKAEVHYADERRFEVPVVLICPEFAPEDAQAWLDAGEIPELAQAEDVTLVDLDSGHWPMLTRPVDLADLLADAARP